MGLSAAKHATLKRLTTQGSQATPLARTTPSKRSGVRRTIYRLVFFVVRCPVCSYLSFPSQHTETTYSCLRSRPLTTKGPSPLGSLAKNHVAVVSADISTSFRKGCIPRPLQNTTQVHEEEPILGIPPLANPVQAGIPTSAQSFLQPLSQAAVSTGLSLGEACRTGGRASTEPVIAAAAAAAAAIALPVLSSQDLGLSLDDDPSSSSGSDDGVDGLWAEDPLASFDRVLDGLLLAPALPQTYSTPSTSSSSSGSTLNLSSLLEQLPLQQGFSTSSSTASSMSHKTSKVSRKSDSSSRRASKSLPAGAAAAAAGPAVTVVHCETEYERELAAAAALQQLLVVKVESSPHLVSAVSRI